MSWNCLLVSTPDRNRPKASPDRSSSAAFYKRFQRNRGGEQGPRPRRRAQAECLIIALLEEIAGALERGKRVELRGVGILTVKERANGKDESANW
jgi:hypothetical protein